jgi:DNA invertase Pin-like site-specific DNA recombinase
MRQRFAFALGDILTDRLTQRICTLWRTTMLALTYARVSTRHLQDDNFSIETQLPVMSKLAKELGATDIMEFIEYESAFDEGLTRTELNRLLDWV